MTLNKKRDYVWTYVRFNSSETTGRTKIKFGTIDHHLAVSVIKLLVIR